MMEWGNRNFCPSMWSLTLPRHLDLRKSVTHSHLRIFCVLTNWRWIMSRGVQGRFFRSNQDIKSLRMELDWTAKKVIHGVGLWRVVAVRWCQIKEMAFITNASIISQIMRIALTDYKIILKLIWKWNIRIGMSKQLIINCIKSTTIEKDNF
jgi:hypothetical protein